MEENEEINNKTRSIKKWKFVLMFILILIHIGFVIYSIYSYSFYSFLIHLTMWSFIFNTFYLIFILIIDSFLFFKNKNTLEKFNKIIRNSIASIIYPFCLTISIGFWGIIVIGLLFKFDSFLSKGTSITAKRVIVNLYYHFIITIIMGLDLFFTEREKINFNKITFLAINIIFCLYGTIVCIDKYYFGNYAYVFMENISIIGLIGTGVGIYALLCGSYFLYIILVNKLNKYQIEDIPMEEEEEENKLVREE